MTPEPCEALEPFFRRLIDIYGEVGAARLREYLATRPSPAFRISRLRAPQPEPVLTELREEGLDVVPLLGAAGFYTVPSSQRERLTHSPAASDGRVHIMNPSSALPVLALQVQPGHSVLDLCAAPGGKTLLLAEQLELVGELSAVEKVRPRFFKLKASLERGGAGRFVRTFLMDGSLVAKKVPARFDRVLVDAPCSSEARIHLDDPSSWEHWSERKVVEMARKQRRLLVAGARALKPGGLLVYSTCSYSVDENEAMVDHALAELRGELIVEDLALSFGDTIPGLMSFAAQRFDTSVTHTRRVLPDAVLHGFFVARFRKRL